MVEIWVLEKPGTSHGLYGSHTKCGPVSDEVRGVLNRLLGDDLTKLQEWFGIKIEKVDNNYFAERGMVVTKFIWEEEADGN